MSSTSGQDALGAFDEVSFNGGSIRTYSASGVVVFSAPGLVLSTRPNLPFSQSYRSVPFSPVQFNTLAEAADSPWLFFDTDTQAYLLSAADNFVLARSTLGSDGSISIGSSQRALLVIGRGFQHVYQTWGQALTALHGKARPPNDADVTLSHLGYWTDNGATYYYRPEPGLSYPDTLLRVREAFDRARLPLGYLQLDSWWYPKGAAARWDDRDGGIFRYLPAPELFPDGLSGFQGRLGLPLVTHARWIDPASPYRTSYAMSGNVVSDPRYWDDRLGALASAGVVTYEQDWLGAQAQPIYNASAAQFLDNMAASAAANRLTLQYCMPLPRHYLQSTLYGNLTSIRVSDDRFERAKWDVALYDAQLASALGIWPWDDVFLSRERDNLLLATLSAGVVGVGDPLGAIDADNLRQTMRGDGVLVKPDVPLAPTDATYLADAQGQKAPMVAATWSQHGLLRDLYVFAYARGADSQAASFTPSALGLDGPAYVYSPASNTGTLLEAGASFTARVPSTGAYFVAAPLGPSGVAFLGDAGRFVPLGRTRISHLDDDGAVHATVEFASGEGPLMLRGYSSVWPEVDGPGVSDVAYDAASGLFTFRLIADKEAQVTIGPVP